MDRVLTHFTLPNIRSKGLALLIEHAPCCLLAFVAGMVGVQALAHNPGIEFGFAIGGAIVGEYIGHKYFHSAHAPHFHRGDMLKRYGLALAIGLATWGLHQQFFHDRHHDDMLQTSMYIAPLQDYAAA